ncbi:hypothetical protein QRN89_09960 [Streptomyces chengbuensis]|uniref:hypothetical protein n=1 Tax=Streptomyces chengbuensis TaxID=3053466 RepID=UPI0025B50120|nr:hypothetical protein [Streptomyces sp. HUAS CB01]WJY50115.1 hypothetical protein QRN89_09960 [Streptomyces sp. HUAS CB01]
MTKEVRQQLLDQNEGFELRTSSVQKNLTEYRTYRISGGQLYIRSSGKTSWADSRFDEERPATDEQTHRFLYEYQGRLNTDGL